MATENGARRASRPAPDDPFLLDVRTPNEWQQRHIDGSVNIPLNRLAAQFNQIPRNRPVVVLCAGGYRSSIAASLLQREGFDRLAELTGGMGVSSAMGLSAVAPPGAKVDAPAYRTVIERPFVSRKAI